MRPACVISAAIRGVTLSIRPAQNGQFASGARNGSSAASEPVCSFTPSAIRDEAPRSGSNRTCSLRRAWPSSEGFWKRENRVSQRNWIGIVSTYTLLARCTHHPLTGRDIIRVAPYRSIGTQPTRLARRPATCPGVSVHAVKAAPEAEVEILPLILFSRRAKAPSKICTFVAIRHASPGCPRRVG